MLRMTLACVVCVLMVVSVALAQPANPPVGGNAMGAGNMMGNGMMRGGGMMMGGPMMGMGADMAASGGNVYVLQGMMLKKFGRNLREVKSIMLPDPTADMKMMRDNGMCPMCGGGWNSSVPATTAATTATGDTVPPSPMATTGACSTCNGPVGANGQCTMGGSPWGTCRTCGMPAGQVIGPLGTGPGDANSPGDTSTKPDRNAQMGTMFAMESHRMMSMVKLTADANGVYVLRMGHLYAYDLDLRPKADAQIMSPDGMKPTPEQTRMMQNMMDNMK